MKEIKALIISANPFSKVLNNGKTYEAIFWAFKSDCLSQLFFRTKDIRYADFDYCNSYYGITESDLIKRLINVKYKCGGKVVKQVYFKNDYQESTIFIPFKKSKYKDILRDILWLLPFWKNKELKQWLNSTDADFIFAVAGGSKYLHKISKYISDFLKVPLVTFFTDDYLINPKFGGLIGKILKKRMKFFYTDTVKRSELLFVIGDEMAKEYTKYFGKIFYPIMNSVDSRSYIEPIIREKPVISYFGGLHLNRWKMIRNFALLVGNRAEIWVYTISDISIVERAALNKVGVKIKSRVFGDELQKAMIDSDILLHVESDNVVSRSFTKLSVSTKIPEYLISGRLVLGYGPPEVASMKLLTDNNIGFLISCEKTNEEMSLDMEQVLTDFDFRMEFGKRAYNFAMQNFDRNRISENFKNKIITVISKSHVIV